jgi:predicted membrane protein
MSIEAFETRIDDAYRCQSPAELDALVADLPAHAASEQTAIVLAREEAIALTPVANVPQRMVRAIFSNIERADSAVMTGSVRVEAVFGNVELDLRETRFGPGVTELRVKAVFGSIEIAVPADVAVEVHGSGIFGNFEGTTRSTADPNAPTLRIVGKAVFASVVVRTVPPIRVEKLVAHLRAQRLLPP